MPQNLNKIIESFNKLNDQARYAIMTAVFLVILAVDVLFLIMPQLSSISDINDQIKKTSDDTDQLITDRGRINQLKKILKEDRQQLGDLQRRVRTMQEVPSILSTISSIANDCGVKIDELVPEKASQEALKTDGQTKYYALPIEIKARCGYHMFGHFINKLENQDLYFLMKEFIIQNDDKDAHNHLFSLTIKLILVEKNNS